MALDCPHNIYLSMRYSLLSEMQSDLVCDRHAPSSIALEEKIAAFEEHVHSSSPNVPTVARGSCLTVPEFKSCARFIPEPQHTYKILI